MTSELPTSFGSRNKIGSNVISSAGQYINYTYTYDILMLSIKYVALCVVYLCVCSVKDEALVSVLQSTWRSSHQITAATYSVSSQ